MNAALAFRFIGGGLAPFAAGKLVEHYNPHVPFVIGAVTVVLAAVLLSTVHRALTAVDDGEPSQAVQTVDDLHVRVDA